MSLISRKNRNGIEARLNFWPAYVDLMVVLALTALIAFSASEGNLSTVEKYKEDAEKIMRILEQELQESNISLKRRGDSIILGDSVLSFQTGKVTPQMDDSQQKVFFSICRAIRDSIDQVHNGRQFFEVVIEGHADSVPIYSSIFPSNWELSSARATYILRMMSDRDSCGLSYDDYSLKAIGYGETRPIEKTRGPSEKNRRIEIKILPNYERIEQYRRAKIE